MGFVDKPHVCDLPMVCHGSVAKVGAWFECDHCKANWRIQARGSRPGHDGFYRLTWVRRVGDYIYTRSWQEGEGNSYPNHTIELL